MQICVINRRTIEQELSEPDWMEDVMGEWFDPDATPPRWLVALRAFENIANSTNPDIGKDVTKAEEELVLLREEAKKITDTFSPDAGVDDKYLKELLRFGRTRLHNMSAFLGGIAAQEACKLVMSQYKPLNHTMVYDGIHGTGQAFNF